MPTVFLSHSHRDKPVARRVFRRLAAHGVQVWLDERELRAGNQLTSSIRTQIQDAGALLVIASTASAESTWVGLELEFAREHGKPVIPFFIEPLDTHPRFRDYLGVDATSLQGFAGAIDRLVRDLFRSYDLDVPPPDPAVLEAELRTLAKEEPDLAPLILGVLDGKGLYTENLDTVLGVEFHALDEAVNALYDLEPAEAAATHAAFAFARTGAGARALEQWIAATGDGRPELASAVGVSLAPHLIPPAMKLLAACNPPNNLALYLFLDFNAARFDEAQRRAAIRLMTWPVRADPGNSGDMLGWVALEHFPDVPEIAQMWARWVREGGFDGHPRSPRDLADRAAQADKEGARGWESINEAIRRHVRNCLRSGDRERVAIAIHHLQSAADAGARAELALLLPEADAAVLSSEWNAWKQRSPETAEWMGRWVTNVAREARGERNWRRARDAAQPR